MFALNLLGGAVLEDDSGPVGGRATHTRRLALLAVLAVARGRGVARERLIGLLWPDQRTDAARHSLSESLYVLRKELGEGALVNAGGEIVLGADALCSDVAEFQREVEEGNLEAAVRLYRGPFLDGFYVGDAPSSSAGRKASGHGWRTRTPTPWSAWRRWRSARAGCATRRSGGGGWPCRIPTAR